MAKIESPRWTQIPNLILGNILKGNIFEAGLMAEMEGAEIKLTLAVYRITIGYHRGERRASLSAMETLTGLSRPTVVETAKKLEEKGIIKRIMDGGVTIWQPIFADEEDDEVVKSFNQSDSQLVKSFNQSSKIILPPSKKETIKEII